MFVVCWASILSSSQPNQNKILIGWLSHVGIFVSNCVATQFKTKLKPEKKKTKRFGSNILHGLSWSLTVSESVVQFKIILVTLKCIITLSPVWLTPNIQLSPFLNASRGPCFAKASAAPRAALAAAQPGWRAPGRSPWRPWGTAAARERP